MAILKSYPSVKEFLEAAEPFLMEREISNNLILGICNNLMASGQESFVVNGLCVIHNDKTMAVVMISRDKALISAATYTSSDIKQAAEFYKEKGIYPKGVFGETLYSEMFSEHFEKDEKREHKLLVHGVTRLEQFIAAPGMFGMATKDDLPFLTDCLYNYEREVESISLHSKEELNAVINKQVEENQIFTWKQGEQVVCTGAILRKTKNYGIIGNVYTPKQFRKKGYATAFVHQLSKNIMAQGFKGCGLFTDTSNLTSNKIYKKIGYLPVAEFSDIGLKVPQNEALKN